MKKDDPEYCPVMDILCPEGEEKARECRLRIEEEYNPIRKVRDFGILCCSYQTSEEMDESIPKV